VEYCVTGKVKYSSRLNARAVLHGDMDDVDDVDANIWKNFEREIR
jgi:hypothetical protein